MFEPARLAHLEATLSLPRHRAHYERARRAFASLAGPTPAADPFALLWAVLDHEAPPCLAERLLADAIPAPLRADLEPLVGVPARLLVVDGGRGGQRRLVDMLDGRAWCSALAAAAPPGGVVMARLAGTPAQPWPVGPCLRFPAAARDVLGSWLLDRFARARASGLARCEAAFYRQVAPLLYRWWLTQREAARLARIGAPLAASPR